MSNDKKSSNKKDDCMYPKLKTSPKEKLKQLSERANARKNHPDLKQKPSGKLIEIFNDNCEDLQVETYEIIDKELYKKKK